jgi:tetratricopeptide (TPR) repeat protein
MEELDFHPEMIGRENELDEIQRYLDGARQGKGSTIFISGEAGIGKTRLTTELKQYAKRKGFKVLSGQSLSESLTPYMPFIEALKSGNMENLFAEEAPRAEAVYLVTHSGLLIEKVLRKETELEPEIFASMLITVGNFVKDSLSLLDGEKKEGTLNSLGYRNYRILIESGESAHLVVVLTGRENEFLIDEMRDVIFDIDRKYGNVLKDWSGDYDELTGIGKLIESLITSGKYDGIYYGSDDPKARRNLLFENVSLGLIRQAKSKPTLLCIEDLHWADPSSLALMHYIARNARKCGLLILGTYRPEDVASDEGKKHPLVSLLRLMNREDLYKKIELQRLSEDTVVEFISSMLGQIDISDEFRNRIYKETEGNPFFMMELIKLLAEENTIVKSNGAWRITKDLQDIRIPSKIHDVILGRLDRLEKEERKILDYASVIGQVFTSIILADALDMERVRLLEQMRDFEQKHRLLHSENGDHRFDHSKIKEVLYDEIPVELRNEYHAIIANSIEALNSENLDAVTGDLAFHYYQARKKEKALRYLLKAADKAKKEYSNEEAIRFYIEALEFEDENKGRTELLDSLGSVYKLTGDYSKALESNCDALKLIEDKRKRAGFLAKSGDAYYRKGDYDKATEILIKGIDLVEGEECEEEALCFSNLGAVHLAKGGYDKALELFWKSHAIREKIGDEVGIAKSLNNIGVVHQSRGDFAKALEFHEKSLAIRERINEIEYIGTNIMNIGVVNMYLGNYDKALEFYEKSLALAEKTCDQRSLAYAFTNIGLVHRQRGDYDKSLGLIERSLKINKKTGHQWGIANSLNNIGYIHAERGDYAKALELQERSLAIREKLGDQHGIAGSLNNISIVYLLTGDYDKALELCRKGLEIASKIGNKSELIDGYLTLAEIYLKKKEPSKAIELCEKSLETSREINMKENIGVSKRLLGMVCRDQNKWGESIENFEESIRILENMGSAGELGESHYEFGLMWKAKGGIEKAKEQLNIALLIFEKLNLGQKVKQAKAAIGEIGPS